MPRRTTSASLLAALMAVVWLVQAASGHPKPGAHADVRIRIDDSAVRLDCVMNLLFVDQLVRSERAGRDDVLPEEESGLRAALGEYFACSKWSGRGPVVFDRPNSVAAEAGPISGRMAAFEVVHPAPETRPGFVQDPALLLPRVRVVVEYPLGAPARRVSLVWGTYPRDFLAQDRDLAPPGDIEAVLTHADQLDLVVFRPGEPEHTWHRPEGRPRMDPESIAPVSLDGGLQVPALAFGVVLVWTAVGVRLARAKRLGAKRALVVCGAAAACAAALWPVGRFRVPLGGGGGTVPDAGAATAVFHALHADIYRAFDFTSEDDIYTALARSVDGPLLDRVYADVYRGLVLQDEGGAMCRVRSVTPVSTQLLGPGEVGGAARGFRVLADWTVEGVVYHWGHSHTRVNQYIAEYTVARTDAGWRIVATRPVEQRRISSETTDPTARPRTGEGVP